MPVTVTRSTSSRPVATAVADARCEVLERYGEAPERAIGPRQHPQPGQAPGQLRVVEASEGRVRAVGAFERRRVRLGGRAHRIEPERRRLEHVVAEHQRIGERVARVRAAVGEVAASTRLSPSEWCRRTRSGDGSAGRSPSATWRRRSAASSRPSQNSVFATRTVSARRSPASCACPSASSSVARALSGSPATRSGPRPARPGSRPAGAGAGRRSGSESQRRRVEPPRSRRRPLELARGAASNSKAPSSPRLGRVLDVVRARDDAGAAALERGGRAGVGGEPPASGRALVDGVADDRVAEGEPPRRAARAARACAPAGRRARQRVRFRDARRPRPRAPARTGRRRPRRASSSRRARASSAASSAASAGRDRSGNRPPQRGATRVPRRARAASCSR